LRYLFRSRDPLYARLAIVSGARSVSAGFAAGWGTASRFFVRPLLARIRRGEGQIVLAAVGLAAAERGASLALLASAVISLAFLASLYGLNDLCDAERDLADPGKDRELALALLASRTRGLWCVGGAQAASTAAAWVAAGPSAGGAVAACAAINALYSLRWKGVPGLDLACAPLWGGSFAATCGGQDPLILGAVGAMTTVCHVFQTRRDRIPDRRNGIRTTSVARPELALAALVLGTAVLAAALALRTSLLVAATAGLPLALALASGGRANQRAWLLSKLWFGIAFLILLGELHGVA
jgi:4-hydroxybenzoate polyprenyltransferase